VSMRAQLDFVQTQGAAHCNYNAAAIGTGGTQSMTPPVTNLANFSLGLTDLLGLAEDVFNAAGGPSDPSAPVDALKVLTDNVTRLKVEGTEAFIGIATRFEADGPVATRTLGDIQRDMAAVKRMEARQALSQGAAYPTLANPASVAPASPSRPPKPAPPVKTPTHSAGGAQRPNTQPPATPLATNPSLVTKQQKQATPRKPRVITLSSGISYTEDPSRTLTRPAWLSKPATKQFTFVQEVDATYAAILAGRAADLLLCRDYQNKVCSKGPACHFFHLCPSCVPKGVALDQCNHPYCGK
jgi:hypothetical protein